MVHSLRGPVGGLLLALVSGACYVNTPLDTGTSPLAGGQMVALDISDRGRVALGERFGTGVAQIEGRLRAITGRAYELQVYKVSYLREGDSRWSGESVAIEREHVSQVYARTLSRGRTAAAAAVFGGGLLAFIITRELVTGGRERDPTEPPPGPETTRLPGLHVIR